MNHGRLAHWLYLVAALAAVLIVVGGFVRLSRAGLSIVEWNPVVGVIPPLTDDAWQAEFVKYQQTPEYRTVNTGMSMASYQRIFYIEWTHRLLARLAGLAVLLPLVGWLVRGRLVWRESGVYLAVVALFGLQGFLGWFMVRSGLLETPAVSHYRLTVHLLMALLLLALALWTGMNRDPRIGPAVRRPGSNRPSWLALVTLAALILQLGYGGLVAGLRAGPVSATWPLMWGALIPEGLFTADASLWSTLTAAPLTVHWVHRWWAIVVLGLTIALVRVRRHPTVSRAARRTLGVTALLTSAQVVLGIGTIWWLVPMALALLHQALGLAIFVSLLIVNHQLLRDDGPAVRGATSPPGTREKNSSQGTCASRCATTLQPPSSHPPGPAGS